MTDSLVKRASEFLKKDIVKTATRHPRLTWTFANLWETFRLFNKRRKHIEIVNCDGYSVSYQTDILNSLIGCFINTPERKMIITKSSIGANPTREIVRRLPLSADYRYYSINHRPEHLYLSEGRAI